MNIFFNEVNRVVGYEGQYYHSKFGEIKFTLHDAGGKLEVEIINNTLAQNDIDKIKSDILEDYCYRKEQGDF